MIIETLVATGCAIIGIPTTYAAVKGLRMVFHQMDEEDKRLEKERNPFRKCANCKQLGRMVSVNGTGEVKGCLAYGTSWPQDNRNRHGDCQAWELKEDT